MLKRNILQGENVLYKRLNICKIFISPTRTFHGIVDMEIANSNDILPHRIKKTQ